MVVAVNHRIFINVQNAVVKKRIIIRQGCIPNVLVHLPSNEILVCEKCQVKRKKQLLGLFDI